MAQVALPFIPNNSFPKGERSLPKKLEMSDLIIKVEITQNGKREGINISAHSCNPSIAPLILASEATIKQTAIAMQTEVRKTVFVFIFLLVIIQALCFILIIYEAR